MRLLAIDPGPEQSALLVYDTDTHRPIWWEKMENGAALGHVAASASAYQPDLASAELHVEMVASYGMPVGAEVFETCVWIGRFLQCWEHFRFVNQRSGLVFRRDVKLHLCHSARASDANIRQALIDRYGPGKEKAIGRKASPGPLYGITGDCWAALAVAITAAETNKETP